MNESPFTRRRHIVCFGNPLHGDDGFGPAVYERLAARKRPASLRLTEAGVPGPAALALFQDCDEVVIVDALAPAGSPGRVHRPSLASVVEEATPAAHGLGLGYVLRALAALPETMPAIEIIGAEVETLTPFHIGLSQPVTRAVDEVTAFLGRYFEAGGHA
ncbi:hydrogenase maturation protease [Methylocystis sp. MJC1]|jgi:hydrogenase maturation protease|uniref:hydrogenase maturation protease n=1 Tax=Methylocystis sp. MJC1 TaxID=2654282 RepID=UPI0013EB7409|nr:hydrogenase maturation protease [Methylocystis sp. MJC1]KAF2992546.1 Hydrogenase 3 maturation protease [Methylocystis sp. MJC1]MBU6526518.1 hydrogenase maturation protease [Methylocystis sp. MJC1]UZX12959.1 hydrogenase maturation protease [Methylocystis sp. MJC1]